MQLTYHAYDKTGRAVVQTIDAPNQAQAMERLRDQGLFVASLAAAPAREQSDSQPTTAARKRRLGRTKRLRHLAMFSRQMTVLLRSGMTVADALYAVQKQSDNAKWRTVMADIRQRVEGGASLSEAMIQNSGCFDGVYSGMVRAGEATGDLPDMLERLSALTTRHFQARTAALGAMVYPALLICVATVVFGVITLGVVPRFGLLFKSLDVPLPPTTHALLNFSAMLRSCGLYIAGGLTALAIIAWSWIKSAPGKRALDGLVLNLPLLGKLVKGLLTARILRLLGVLMDARLPALDALHLARGALSNSLYINLLDRTSDGVADGKTIAAGLTNTDLISPAAVEALHSAETSGRMGEMLTSFSDFMDEENGLRLKLLTSIIEPAILLFMGLIVALLAISLFLPLFDLTAMAGGPQ